MLKGSHRVISEALKRQALEQLHVDHVKIKKTKLLACESTYWPGINNDIENHIKDHSTCLDFQETLPKEKIIHCQIPGKPWEVIRVPIHNRNYLSIVD